MFMSRILVVDDETKITKLLADRIAREGMEVSTCASAEEALPRIEGGDIDIVLCDLRLGGMSGLDLLKQTKRAAPGTDFVVMTAYASAATAIEAMRQGAYEYLIKPFEMDEVVLLLKRIQERRDLVSENAALRERMAGAARAGKIVGESAAVRGIRELIEKVAPTDAPVLVQGESGTGKELVAAEIHARSARAREPFVVLNCAAVPETLLESEMFGFERGAFTGASQKKPGQFRLADGGTLFMDEIGEMPLAIQAKLLRAIELGEFTPLGGSKSVTVNVRIVAATNRDLDELVRAGMFREDLFYRLNVFPIRIPPLRDRKDDIPPLAARFIETLRMVPATSAPAPLLSDAVVSKLRGYSWPGNVRELKNVLERAVILAGRAPISPEHIMIMSPAAEQGSLVARLRSLLGESTLPDIERKLIELALEESKGNKSKAAALLGITRRTLYGRLERFGIQDDGGSDDAD
jgi:two-component system, NtrC family, response regulator AtoC